MQSYPKRYSYLKKAERPCLKVPLQIDSHVEAFIPAGFNTEGLYWQGLPKK